MQAYYFYSMNLNRINLLTQFLAEEPNNPFNLYALAMEYRTDKPETTRLYFDQLLTEHSDYLPTYYHAAALYAELNERDKVADLYEKGIRLAQTQQNQKTLLELQRAKQAFEDEEDW